MGTVVYSKGQNGEQTYNASRLFFASCVALIATALAFTIRATDVVPALQTQFHFSMETIGNATGILFLGYSISLVIASQLLDVLKMGRMLAIAFCCHLAGVIVTITAQGYNGLWGGALLLGLGSGLIEVTINPLIATLYRDDKTAKLNRLHSWFPGGNAIAAVGAWGLTNLFEHSLTSQQLWQLKMAVILIPVIAYGALFLGQKFPETERVQSNVPTRDMYRELLRPLFLLWVCCMLLTASTELATTSWIPTILAGKSGDHQILVVAWINIIMLVGRMYAGKVVHALSPIRMLIGSAFFALIGLLALGTIHGFAPAFFGATLFAIGVCYFWPTMLGVTSERFPRGGAFLMGVIGGAGMLSVYTVIPMIGKVLDAHKDDPTFGFKVMAILPAVLILVFSGVYFFDKSRGGYKAEILGEEPVSAKQVAAR